MNFSWFKAHKIVSVLLFTVMLFIGIIGSNSMIVGWGLMSWLKDHASDVELGELKLSFWNSQLDIKGLMASNQHGDKLVISDLKINWVWSDIWYRKLTIPFVDIEGVKLNIKGSNFNPEFIGPINLATLIASEPVQEEKQQSSKPWSINLGTVTFSDSTICYQDAVLDYAFLGLPLTDKTQKIDVCTSWSELKSDTNLLFSLEEGYSFTGNINLQELNLADAETNELLKIKDLVVSELSIQPQATRLKQLSINDIHFLAQQIDDVFADSGVSLGFLRIKDLNWNNTTATTQIESISGEKLFVKLRAFDNKMHTGLTLGALTVKNTQISEALTTVDSIIIDQIGALEKIVESSEIEYLTGVNHLAISNINLSSQKLQLDQLSLFGLSSLFILDSDGLNISQWMMPMSKGEDIAAKEEALFAISIADISLTDNSQITLIDKSTENSVQQVIKNIDVNVKNLQLGESNKEPSKLIYSALFGDSGTINGKGYFISPDNNIELDIAGQMKNVDLVNLTDYSARFIGYRIDSGLLNLDYQVKIKDNKIDAKLNNLFEKFNLATLQEHEQSPMNEELGIPLPLALNLLRDGDDNIELDLPISGDVDAPDFSVASIISIVTMKAIKEAVIYNYSPLGMISLASGIFDLATALRFDPIIFEPQTIVLTDKSKQQLDKVAKIMVDKPKVKFVICAQATRSDRVVNETPVEKTFEPQPLLDLAKQRQIMVLDYILTNKAIESSRLIGCNVKLSNDSKSKPKVEISI